MINFIYCATKSRFEEQIDNVHFDDIVFIEDTHEIYTRGKTIVQSKEELIVNVTVSDEKKITSIDKTYSEVKAAVDLNKRVYVKCTYSSQTFYLNLSSWKTGLIAFFDFTELLRIGTTYTAFTVRLGTQTSMNFSYIETVQLTNEKINAWSATPSTSTSFYPTEALVWNTFRRKPDVIYNDPDGFEAVDEDAGKSWYLTGLDLSKYKFLKFYVTSGGDSNTNYSS